MPKKQYRYSKLALSLSIYLFIASQDELESLIQEVPPHVSKLMLLIEHHFQQQEVHKRRS